MKERAATIIKRLLTERTVSKWEFYTKARGLCESDRYSALGIPEPDVKTMCNGQCEGTGVVPIHQDDQDEPWRSLWLKAEEKNGPTKDGYHFVPCPDCEGTGKES